MVELSAQQMQVMERLLAAGFRPITIPPYESAFCVRKENCAAVLGLVPNGGMKLLAPPSYMVDGNLSVKLKRGASEVFVWKKKEVQATTDRLRELEVFRGEIREILEATPRQ